MPQMINYGNEMLRINSSNNRIEYSRDNGHNWHSRYCSSSSGQFVDLLPYGNEILAITSKGVYYSKDGGQNWHSRYTSSSSGTFQSLQNGGSELLAITDKGLYYSKDGGHNWHLRHR